MCLFATAPVQAQTAQTVPPDWQYIPSGVSTGQSFRLLFVTSTKRNAQSSNIADYNSFVQTRAATNTHLSGFSSQFRALASTAATDARDNTGTTGTSAPIYWLGGAKAADGYGDFYDGSWDSRAAREESGNLAVASGGRRVWTGSRQNGTELVLGGDSTALGTSEPAFGIWNRATETLLSSSTSSSTSYRLYALSPVITVVPPKPEKPTGFTARAGNAQVTLSWADPRDSSITKYQYRQKTGNGAYGSWTNIPSSAPGGSNATSYTVTSLNNGTAYRFRIRAVNAGGNGPESDEAGPVTPAVPPKPAKPTRFRARPGNTQVTLSWADPRDSSITKYQYRQKTGSGAYGSWTDIPHSAPGGANATSYTVTGLENGTEYRFKIRAVNAQGNGPESDEAGPVTPAASSLPKKPTGFTGQQTGNGRVTLNWDNPNDPNIVKYRVFVEKEGTSRCCPWSDIPGSNADTTSDTVYDLENGASYVFRVKAVYEQQARTSSYGEIPASDPVRVRLTLSPPAKPDVYEIEATTSGSGTVTLSWNNPYDDSITKYQVRHRKRREAWTGWRDIEGSSAGTGYHIVTGLEHDVEHGVQIRAVNARGAGPASDERRATPKWPEGTVVVHGQRLTYFKVRAGDEHLELSWLVTAT